MKEKTSKITFLSIICVVMMALFAITALHLGGLRSIAENEDLKEEYEINEEVNIPDYYFGNGSVKATKRLIMPDGSAFSGDVFITENIGKYTVEYTAKGYEAYKKEFYVRVPLAECSGEVFYGAYKNTPNTNGLNVRIGAQDTFYYNDIIDLTKSNKDKSFITFYAAPEDPGTLEFVNLVVRLTDLYDDSNYIDIQFKRSDGGRSHGVTYISAGATGQGTAGQEWDGGGVHYNDPYGLGAYFSLWGSDKSGNWDEEIIKNNNVSLFFDVYEKKLYCDKGLQGTIPVCDFDDLKYFPRLWNGFTDGKVRLSIYAKDMNKLIGGIVITDILGQDLSRKHLEIKEPVITVDELFDEVPTALINRAYPVYEASGYDNYEGYLQTQTKVYYNYNSPTETTVNFIDGCFTPKRVGVYTVEYTAKNSFGAIGKAVYYVTCVEKHDPIKIQIGEASTSGTAGYPVKIADVTVSGGVGTYDMTVKVTAPDGNKVELTDGYFIPVTSGNYMVKYNVSDYVKSTQTAAYAVSVTIDDKPVFDTETVFPEYFINNYEYELPVVYAYDYNDGGKKLTPTVYVTENGIRRALQNNKITFSIANQATKAEVLIEYVVNGKKASNTYSKTVTVINVFNENNLLDMSAYFVSDTVSHSADSGAVILTASENGEATFLNCLSAEQLSFVFKIGATLSITSFNRTTICCKIPKLTAKLEIGNCGCDKFNTI